jgi:hypothetical protein
MAYQKTYNAVVLLLLLFFFFGCKKLSKEYTTARWDIINPVTKTPYVGIPVRLILGDYRGSSPKYEVIWEGETNSQGIAEHKFKGYTNPSFGYLEEANLSVLGVGGIDYSIIRRPYAGGRPLDELNELRYEIVPYAYLKQIIKNNNCEGSEDVLNMHMYLKNFDGGINQEYTRNGCYEFETTGSLDGSPDGYRRVYMGTYVYDYEVVRSGGTTYGTDSITLSTGELGTIEVLY